MDPGADAVKSGRDFPGAGGRMQRTAEANWEFLRRWLASTLEERFRFRVIKAPRYHSTPIKLASIH